MFNQCKFQWDNIEKVINNPNKLNFNSEENKKMFEELKEHFQKENQKLKHLLSFLNEQKPDEKKLFQLLGDVEWLEQVKISEENKKFIMNTLKKIEQEKENEKEEEENHKTTIEPKVENKKRTMEEIYYHFCNEEKRQNQFCLGMQNDVDSVTTLLEIFKDEEAKADIKVSRFEENFVKDFVDGKKVTALAGKIVPFLSSISKTLDVSKISQSKS